MTPSARWNLIEARRFGRGAAGLTLLFFSALALWTDLRPLHVFWGWSSALVVAACAEELRRSRKERPLTPALMFELLRSDTSAAGEEKPWSFNFERQSRFREFKAFILPILGLSTFVPVSLCSALSLPIGTAFLVMQLLIAVGTIVWMRRVSELKTDPLENVFKFDRRKSKIAFLALAAFFLSMPPAASAVIVFWCVRRWVLSDRREAEQASADGLVNALEDLRRVALTCPHEGLSVLALRGLSERFPRADIDPIIDELLKLGPGHRLDHAMDIATDSSRMVPIGRLIDLVEAGPASPALTRAITLHRDQRATQLLMRILDDRELKTTLIALKGLGKMGGRSAVERIVWIEKNAGDGAVRAAAREAIDLIQGRLGPVEGGGLSLVASDDRGAVALVDTGALSL